VGAGRVCHAPRSREGVGAWPQGRDRAAKGGGRLPGADGMCCVWILEEGSDDVGVSMQKSRPGHSVLTKKSVRFFGF
jgi:hypothetical protein